MFESRFFVNLQTNGRCFGGVPVDLSGPSLTQQQVEALIRESLTGGVVPCPTTITQDPAQHLRNLGTIADALAACGMTGRFQHVEGPFFLNTKALGAHNPKHIQAASVDLLNRLIEASQDTIAILTVGPDVAGICDVIAAAKAKGIVVSLGHHLAELSQVQEAIAAGASWLTHFGNGIPLQVNRQGILDFQLDCDGLGAMVIPDGSHTAEHFLHLVHRVKGVYRMLVVSDQSPYSGAPVTPDGQSLDLWGSKVRVVKHPTLDTRWIVGENGMLAGSWATMLDCMNYLASLFLKWNRERGAAINVERDLWRVGRDNPLSVLGRSADEFSSLPLGRITWREDRFYCEPWGQTD